MANILSERCREPSWIRTSVASLDRFRTMTGQNDLEALLQKAMAEPAVAEQALVAFASALAGSTVSNVAVGDTVIVHPLITCGFCRACRAGDDVHCINSAFPGIGTDGGMANFLKTSARSVVKLDPSLHPKDKAALADAGLTRGRGILVP
jgi:NADPH:quinone reductase-like Zn-dependent oxidoreductase